MLENINLKAKLSHNEYKEALPALQRRLYDLERACWEQGIPSIILFEGWDASGKGTAIAGLTQRLDPRGFKLYPITAPRTYEQQRPWLWRFWLKVPNKGEMVILDRSWYFRVLDERVERAIPEKAWRDAYRDIVEFEGMPMARSFSSSSCTFPRRSSRRGSALSKPIRSKPGALRTPIGRVTRNTRRIWPRSKRCSN